MILGPFTADYLCIPWYTMVNRSAFTPRLSLIKYIIMYTTNCKDDTTFATDKYTLQFGRVREHI